MTDNVWQESEISLNIPEGDVEDTKIDDRASLLPGESGGASNEAEPGAGKSGFLSFDFYQSLFDVDTDTVCNRLRSAIIPKKNYNFIESVLRARRRSGPDMYGPFWICTTLVFSTAICGNLANFIAQQGSPTYNYSPEFEKVSLVASSVFGYAYFVPVILWFIIKYNVANNSVNYRFMEILCTYGYSLFVYIPISILWVFPVESFRWLLVITGAAVSGSMLAQAFYPVVKSEKKQLIYLLLGVIISLNLVLAVGFKMYFFEAKMNQLPGHLQSVSQDDNSQPGLAQNSYGAATDNVQPRSVDEDDAGQHIAAAMASQGSLPRAPVGMDSANQPLNDNLFNGNPVENTPLTQGLQENNDDTINERVQAIDTGSVNAMGNSALVGENGNLSADKTRTN